MALNPVVASAVGSMISSSVCVEAIVWDASSTAGDTVELRDPVDNRLLWCGRAADAYTYQGISFGVSGLSCPNGVRLSQISSGRVLVYSRVS